MHIIQCIIQYTYLLPHLPTNVFKIPTQFLQQPKPGPTGTGGGRLPAAAAGRLPAALE